MGKTSFSGAATKNKQQKGGGKGATEQLSPFRLDRHQAVSKVSPSCMEHLGDCRARQGFDLGVWIVKATMTKRPWKPQDSKTARRTKQTTPQSGAEWPEICLDRANKNLSASYGTYASKTYDSHGNRIGIRAVSLPGAQNSCKCLTPKCTSASRLRPNLQLRSLAT